MGLEQLDKVMKSYGLPVGPITLADEVTRGSFKPTFRCCFENFVLFGVLFCVVVWRNGHVGLMASLFQRGSSRCAV